MPAAFQPGGSAATAIASGSEKSTPTITCFTLLRPLMRRATGAKMAFIVRGSEDLEFFLGRRRRAVVARRAQRVEPARLGLGAVAPGDARLERALRVGAHGAVEIALQQRARLVREQRQRLRRGAERWLVQALELLARDVLELHRHDDVVDVRLDIDGERVDPLQRHLDLARLLDGRGVEGADLGARELDRALGGVGDLVGAPVALADLVADGVEAAARLAGELVGLAADGADAVGR